MISRPPSRPCGTTISGSRCRSRTCGTDRLTGWIGCPRSGRVPSFLLVVVAGVHVEARDVLAAEHRDVAAVVFDGEAQLEPVGAQIPDRGLLELPGEVVVTERPHHEEIPADPVSAQPGLGQRMDPLRSGGEQHDPQVAVEEVEEDTDLFDHLVLAAGVEEPSPVASRRLEVVLAARGVGEDSVKVDDRRGAGPDGPVAPRPMLRGFGHSSSPPAWPARYRALIPSTTAGSARVVVSPNASSSLTLRSSRRMILPDRVFGRSSVNRIVLGLAIGPMVCATGSRSASTRASLGSLPDRRITNAAMAFPVVASVLATTAASATAGCPTSACSTSAVEMLWPETSMTSSTRPRSQ